MDDLELDQDTGIWRPKRRTFLIMTGMALAGTILGPTGEAVTLTEINHLILPPDEGAWRVGLGTLTLGTQPGRTPGAPREYVVVDGHPTRNPEYRVESGLTLHTGAQRNS